MRSDRLLQAAFDRARTGRPAVLSWLFRRVIPFNAPHGLRIAAVATGPDGTAVAVVLPWRRRNRNHIGTVHACALATAAEFATGLGLVEAARPLGPFRLVMARLEVDYTRRASSTCTARSHWPAERLAQAVADLARDGSVVLDGTATVVDADGTEVAVARTVWHIRRTADGRIFAA